MRINILGAGPAGLYAAILLKRMRADLDVAVFEQNPAGATFGFGVVFSDQALDFLRADDPETADLIEPHMQRWSDIVVNHKGTPHRHRRHRVRGDRAAGVTQAAAGPRRRSGGGAAVRYARRVAGGIAAG